MTAKIFNEWVNLYADGVYRFIVKNLRHEEDARDIVQGAFEKLWINREQVEEKSVKSYLFTIAYNLMIDHLRKNKRTELKDNFREEAKVERNHGRELKQILNEALEQLPAKWKSLVLLKDYEGYSYEEIGNITGLNSSQVRVYLHRARLQLREYLVSVENNI
jgi:RNA polymerase sigma factor (sigma-70 family)